MVQGFVGALQGTYAYLVIFEVILVSGLLLGLLFLIAKRMKVDEAKAPKEKPAEVPAAIAEASVAPVSAPTPEMEAVNKEQAEKITALETQIEAMQKSGAVSAPGTQLEDKVKYLESKLVEYEILQEEISQLKHLKRENEIFRHQIQSLTGKPPEPVLQEEDEVAGTPAQEQAS